MLPDLAPELTGAERRVLEERLRALREELAEALEGAGEASKPVDLDEPIGRVSRIDAIQQQQMARAGREGLVLRAKQVQAALLRIEAGTYGECLACEEPVGFARLSARPETPFCIACQARRERR